MQFLKLFEYVNDIYAVKKFSRENLHKRLYWAHIRKIIDRAKPVYKISAYTKFESILYQEPLAHLLETLFDPSEFYFSCKDVAAAIFICAGGIYNNEINKEDIINFSLHFTRELKETLRGDPIIFRELSSISKDANNIVDNNSTDEVANILSSKKAALKQYFSRFEDGRFGDNSSVTVWHPSEENPWVEWKDEDSITIHIDRSKVKSGFYLPGLDYSDKTRGWLGIATSDGEREYFNNSHNLKNNKIVWLR